MGASVDLQSLHAEIAKKFDQIKKNFAERVLSFEPDDIQVLNNMDEVSKDLAELESVMSTYLLNSMLSEYTCSSKVISHSIQNLLSKGYSAVIVVENNDPVSPFLMKGKPIYAQISTQLLESLFHPDIHYHEGAVLIQDDKIVSASNELPNTERVYWDRIYDSRERSAIGLTERCDALVLLVYENGSTSFCVGGNLYPFSAK